MAAIGNKYDAIARSIARQCQAEPKAIHYNYTGGIVAGGTTVDFYDIRTIDWHRDFVGNFSDIITIEVLMDVRKFYNIVLPNLENLEGYIQARQMMENSLHFIRGGHNFMRRYKAVVVNPPKQGLGGGGSGQNEIKNPDISVQYVTFQFIDKIAVDIKLTTFQGMFEMSNPMEVASMILDGTGKDHGLTGVHRADWDVQNKRQILIPRGTLVKDIPQYMQQEYGIYNHGIGSYLYRMPVSDELYWYLYPLFNSNRYEKEYFKLSISVLPKEHNIAEVPRTYVIDNGNITIMVTDEVAMKENKTADQLNQGTGISFTNPAENRAITTEEVGANRVMKQGEAAISTINVVDRPDGLQNIIQVNKDTMNTANLISQVAGNAGNYVVIDWKHAHPHLLQPGMPVKIQYFNQTMNLLYGTLHEYHAIAVKTGKTGYRETPYACTVRMVIHTTPSPNVAL